MVRNWNLILVTIAYDLPLLCVSLHFNSFLRVCVDWPLRTEYSNTKERKKNRFFLPYSTLSVSFSLRHPHGNGALRGAFFNLAASRKGVPCQKEQDQDDDF
jgi:hypothetical protein